MDHFSIDLETLGTRYSAAILSIGAQQFDIASGKLGKTFYKEIELSSAIKAGTITADTLHWWLHQNDKARRVFGKENKVVLAEALFELSSWLRGSAIAPKVWGNGAAFDISILEYAYDHGGVGIHEGWHYTNIRDMRTLREAAEALGWRTDLVSNVGVAHNALDDATRQAKAIASMWALLVGKKQPAVVPTPKPASEDDDL